ncbi:hypothetical protein SmphiM6_100 [Sinorhizobium phage phiM6]|nr:hypothetical protein SmphiM6_100 [Sinorhizobium phage phiM6]
MRVFKKDRMSVDRRRLEPPATTHLSYFDHAEALRKEFRL